MALISTILLIISLYLNILIKQRFLINLIVSPYECGFDPYNSAYNNAIAKFYLVALLYLIFDLELSFVLPISFVFQYLTNLSTICLLFFILIIGFIFEKYFDIIGLSHFS